MIYAVPFIYYLTTWPEHRKCNKARMSFFTLTNFNSNSHKCLVATVLASKLYIKDLTIEI